MTSSIKVSENIVKEFERLKKELHALSPNQEITDDQIMEAMIGGFFDSLEHMKQAHAHHHHDDHECCGKHDHDKNHECGCK